MAVVEHMDTTGPILPLELELNQVGTRCNAVVDDVGQGSGSVVAEAAQGLDHRACTWRGEPGPGLAEAAIGHRTLPAGQQPPQQANDLF
ncbi:hypothetical protein D3C78_1363880 [compost metagenome]